MPVVMFEVKKEFVDEFVTLDIPIEDAVYDIGEERFALFEEEVLNHLLVVGEDAFNDLLVGICDLRFHFSEGGVYTKIEREVHLFFTLTKGFAIPVICRKTNEVHADDM